MWAISVLGALLVGSGITLAILGLTGALGESDTPGAGFAPIDTTSPAAAVPRGRLEDVAEIAALVIPSTVTVESLGELGVGGGSGVVFDSEGHIVTNNHVVAEAENVSVIFSDGNRYDADVIGTDRLTDIAVLEVIRSDLTPIETADVSAVSIGDATVAVGSPLGLLGGPSVTTGVVSATGRSLPVEGGTLLYGLVQTDAPITRGSSGGALVDASGRLIGITTAIAISDVGAEGLGFAVPADLVASVAADLIDNGEVAHALLGVRGSTATRSTGEATRANGVDVSELTDGSAFARSGGETGDVIAALDGEPVRSLEDLISKLRYRRAGETAQVTVDRNGTELTLDVELDRWRETP